MDPGLEVARAFTQVLVPLEVVVLFGFGFVLAAIVWGVSAPGNLPGVCPTRGSAGSATSRRWSARSGSQTIPWPRKSPVTSDEFPALAAAVVSVAGLPLRASGQLAGGQAVRFVLIRCGFH